MNLHLGIDFGTSGARAIAIDAEGHILARSVRSYTIRDIATWQPALLGLIEQIPIQVRQQIRAIAIDGTSATVLLCDATGQPIAGPLLYDDARGAAIVPKLQDIVPPGHIALSATSSLAKLAWFLQNSLGIGTSRPYFLHQADWLAWLLHGNLGIGDYHNALKLGYDVELLRYPDWLTEWQDRVLLPQVVAPGSPIRELQPHIASKLGLPLDCTICAGTTDSTAAFLASVGVQPSCPGTAVTSLGSTLVLKILSQTRVDDARYGIYSHRMGNLWLVGGASNTGGAVLRQFFSDTELADLSRAIPAQQASPLDYYPLLKAGERFPIDDPTMPPRLQPRPSDRVEFLHGLLESIARIEAKGYRLLQDLGASPITHIYTTGGGAANATWTQIRSRLLQVPLLPALQTEAAYGAALLALQNYPAPTA